MSDWSTYALSDFLMFSPQAYWRLVARYNDAWWPSQLLGAAAGLGLLVLPARRDGGRRAALLLLAAAWAWVGWAFHGQRYAEIFLGAPWLAAGFAVEATMLAAAAFLRRADAWPARAGVRAPGFVLLALALSFPLLAPLAGRGWNEAEVFGFMPDPTALATLGALLALPRCAAWLRALLAVVPVLSLALGAATRWLLA